MIKLVDILKEMVEGNNFSLYHRTTIPKAKQILSSPSSKLTPGDGRAGVGTYYVYGDPKEISSSMDAYGGASLKYIIPVSSLSNFLIFDKNLQILPLSQQLQPLKDLIGEDKFNETINLYNNNKLNQLEFIEELIAQGINLANYFDGIIYGAKSISAAFGFSQNLRQPGTAKTAIVYNQSLLTFDGISTDGVNYKKPQNTKSEIVSPEKSLIQGKVSDGSTLKKTLINLQNSKISNLPDDLNIIGSLDIRDTSIENLPKGLKIKNTLYMSSNLIDKLPQDIQFNRLFIRPLTKDNINTLEKLGFKYTPSYDIPENDMYLGSFKK